MLNRKLLKETIEDRGITISALSRKTGLSREAVYRKLKNPNSDFTASQIISFTKALRLTPEERDSIFFNSDMNHIHNK